MGKPRCMVILAGMAVLLTFDGFGAEKLTRPEGVGSIEGIKGTVLIDHHPVLLKEAVFAGEVVSTGGSSGASLNLHGTAAVLVENSELALAGLEDSNAMTLIKGALEIRSGNSRPVLVKIPGASVIVRSEGAFPGICRIASVNKSAVVIADRGHVEIHGSGAPTIVPPGKTIHLEAGIPQAGGQVAGKVEGEIPKGMVQRGGKGTPISLVLSDTVYWEDVVQTLGNGRVRVALLGGSFLNIGARSQMRIVQHDPGSQQTQVELTLGRLRGEVVHLTKGDAKFETRTPTAVIGVVGTIYIADAAPKVTRVWSVQDDVMVRNADPKVPGSVTLHTGQFTIVRYGQPPTSPSTAPANQLQTELSDTEVPQGGPTGVQAGGQQGGVGQPSGGQQGGGQAGTGGTSGGVVGGARTGGINFPGGSTGLFTLAAAGVSAGVGGVAIHDINTANNGVNTAGTSLSGAGAAAADAQNAAGQAQSATQQILNINNATAAAVNGILQGCGCVSPTAP